MNKEELRERLLAGKLAAKGKEKNSRPYGVLGAGKHIRKFCLECMGGPGGESANLVKFCPGTTCPLWYWRFGKDPKAVKDTSLLDPEHVKAAERARRK